MTPNPLCHIVLYSFASENELDEGVRIMLGLKDKCLRDGKKYVLDVHAGTTQPHAPVRTLGTSEKPQSHEVNREPRTDHSTS